MNQRANVHFTDGSVPCTAVAASCRCFMSSPPSPLLRARFAPLLCSSGVLQFIARDASKPGRPALRPLPIAPGGQEPAWGDLWTGVSTATFAADVIAAAGPGRGGAASGKKAAEAAAAALTAELGSALGPFAASSSPDSSDSSSSSSSSSSGGGSGALVPLHTSVKR